MRSKIIQIKYNNKNYSLFSRCIEYKAANEGVLIIPGRNDTSYSFVELIKSLDVLINTEKQYNIYALDIAWGNSDIFNFKYTLENQAEIIRMFIDQYLLQNASSCHLIGHSMGGELVLLTGCLYASNQYLKTITSLCPALYKRDSMELLDILAFSHLSILAECIISPEFISKRMRKINIEISKYDSHKIYSLLIKNKGINRLLKLEREFQYFTKDSVHINEYCKSLNNPLMFMLAENDEKLPANTESNLLRDFFDNEKIFKKSYKNMIDLFSKGNRYLLVHKKSYHPLHYKTDDIAPLIADFITESL